MKPGNISGTILVVDDETQQRHTLADILKQWGHQVSQAASVEEALSLLDGQAVDLILSDIRMPGSSGVDLLVASKKLRPDVAVILMTAYGTIDTAVKAMRQGASDFLTKPIDLDQLELVTQRTFKLQRLEKENQSLRRRLEESSAGFRLIGESQALKEVLSRAGRAASTEATVLIQGESGTGKSCWPDLSTT